jgi:hypothetical protein
VQQVPTIEKLQTGITQMLLQRAALKDQIEALDKQLPVLQGQLQLLQAQQAEPKD